MADDRTRTDRSATDLGRLATEQGRDLADLDLRATTALVDLMVDDQADAIQAVRAARDSIATAIEAIVERLEQRDGRLVYVGAGTAGRLGLLDASECPPTFNTERVVAVLAGGRAAFTQAKEGAEDDPAAAEVDLDRLEVSAADVVVGITASGRTPYTVAAVQHSRRRGALTVGISSNPETVLSASVDHPIEVLTGPELIAGSTRLKAGTAQKVVLNTLSTVVMVRLGKTFGNLMVDVRATNDKLRDRARRIVTDATGCDRDTAADVLAATGGDLKAAIVVELAGVDATEAVRRLKAAGGRVRTALEM